MMGTKLFPLLFSTRHPQTYSQTKIINQSFGNLLRCLLMWYTLLLIVEFAYNNSINSSIGQSPFEIIVGITPHLPIDSYPLSYHFRSSEEAKNFSKQSQDIHSKEVN